MFRRLSFLAPGLVLCALVIFSSLPSAQAQSASTCSIPQPAFCETFDAPQNGGTRSGDLNPTIWGVSRTTGHMNPGAFNNAWATGSIDGCGGGSSPPPRDVRICNGQLREVTNDGDTVTTLAMYPKQPFDFAGRTGRITFDVSNDSHGSHEAWPELWVTDRPVPAPFAHEATWKSVPRHGFGLRFAGYLDGNGNPASCPGGTPAFLGVDSAIAIRNYVVDDTFDGGSLHLRGDQCVRAATSPGQMNHYEVQVSQNQIDVYGTDAGTTSPLKHIAQITNANLSFTRGLVWIEDSHYNGNKFSNQGTHTFVWDNLGFDGPFTYRDLSYDALDNNQPAGDGTTNLGKFSQPGQQAAWSVLGLDNSISSVTQRVMFNFYTFTKPTSLNVTVNGHPHTFANPYPDGLGYTWRTVDFDLPRSDLVNGTNTVLLGSNQAMVSANVNIVLVNVGGSPPPPPTDTPVPPTATSVPPTATSVPPTSTALPADTPVPTATSVPAATPTPSTILCEVLTRINGTQTWVQKPADFCQ